MSYIDHLYLQLCSITQLLLTYSVIDRWKLHILIQSRGITYIY